MNKLMFGSLVAVALSFAVVRADNPDRADHRDHPHHRPPQAAFDACAKAKLGDACSVTMADHTVNGLCHQARDGEALFCRPDHPPGPPPEAIAACNGRSAGDACTVSHGDHAVSGTCAKHPDHDGPLACRPSGPPPPR